MTIKQHIKQISLAALLALAACSPKVDTRGYSNDDDWKKGITIGKTTKDDVQDLLGSPSAQSSFGAETWYYMRSRKETVAFFKPEVVAQDVAQIEFDSTGVVSDVKTYTKNDAKEFDLVKRTTPTEGHTLNFFEQVLGNLGRFNKEGGSSGPTQHSTIPGH